MSEAAYKVRVHRGADRELDALSQEFDTDDLEDKIRGAAECRQPKTHTCVEPLAGYPELLKVRGVGLRAICKLQSPEFWVLLVDKRTRVYDRLDVAVDRAGGGR